ncbi:MAG: tyrosine-type recombinase/integrase, partial [Tetragenococcus koreensis]|nr:tyrosine-type recombinase/integrase [Tetragenococcus koreensis]
PYYSNFKIYIEGMVEQKQSLGYPYVTSERILRSFDEYCMTYFPNEYTLTSDIVMGWAALRENEHSNGLLRRVTPVRQLAKYMNSIGGDAYVLPSNIPKKQIRYVPHIFTSQELSAFFKAVDACPISPLSLGRHLVIPVFFRLLYCCGLRSSEARMLQVSDMDFKSGSIFIRKSKGHKDRNIFLSDDMIHLCKVYHERIDFYYPNRTAFFPNQKGRFYNRSLINYWFHLFWDNLTIAKSHTGNPPRVHDFRHTFAVNRLNHWVNEGKDINAYLPYLSMYLGHENQADTDYYLHLVPEFFPVFRDKSREISENLLPEVDYE